MRSTAPACPDANPDPNPDPDPNQVCAYDVENDAILPFQSLAARPRKAPTAEQAAATPLCVFAFDLLLHDGVGLLQMPLAERRRRLREHMQPVRGRLALALGTEVGRLL